MPLYDSVVDSHAHGLSFPPTLVVVGALMLKRWIVQIGASEVTVPECGVRLLREAFPPTYARNSLLKDTVLAYV